jgi:hypothetical protein
LLCTSGRQVIVVWNNVGVPVPDELRALATVLTPAVNSINNKFIMPSKIIRTLAVISIDDDTTIKEVSAGLLFHYWKHTVRARTVAGVYVGEGWRASTLILYVFMHSFRV